MGKIIVITSGKGGVGKTTVTANLGTALAMKGKRTLLIDTDTGLRNLDIVLGKEDEVLYDNIDLSSGTSDFEEVAIVSSKYPNLYFIPASQTKDKEELDIEKFKDLCYVLKKRFDYILIDCPAGIEYGFKCALAPADEALIVTIPDRAALRDADRVAGIIEGEFKNISKVHLCINRFIPELSLRGVAFTPEEALFQVGVKLIGIVPEDPNVIIDAYKSKLSVNNRSSKAGKAFKNMAGRINGENIKLEKIFKKRLYKRKYR